MRTTWEKNGTKCPFFTVPYSPFFSSSKIFTTVPFVKNQVTALTDGRMGNLAPHRLTTTAISADARERYHGIPRKTPLRRVQTDAIAGPHLRCRRRRLRHPLALQVSVSLPEDPLEGQWTVQQEAPDTQSLATQGA